MMVLWSLHNHGQIIKEIPGGVSMVRAGAAGTGRGGLRHAVSRAFIGVRECFLTSGGLVLQVVQASLPRYANKSDWQRTPHCVRYCIVRGNGVHAEPRLALGREAEPQHTQWPHAEGQTFDDPLIR